VRRIYEKGTNMTDPEHSPQARPGIGLIASLQAVLLGAAGSAALAVCFLSQTAPAFAAPAPPTFTQGTTVEHIHATRATFTAASLNPHELETSSRTEYATSEAGPWTLVATATCTEPRGTACNPGAQFTHLTPQTHYFARVVARNALGEATIGATFATTAISGPEVGAEECDQRPIIGGGMCATPTTTSATLATTVQTNGAETDYRFEEAESEAGPFTAVPGGDGKVTASEDSAHPEVPLTGLAPETTYYVRVTATNSKGTEVSGIGAVETLSIKPEASGEPNVQSVTATSAHLSDGIYGGTFETRWRVELATSPSGPWTQAPGADGTISASEASQPRVVEAELAGLNPGTTYYFRFAAENEPVPGEPHEAISPVETFETNGPPTAETFPVHAIHGAAVRLLGAVSGHGFDTHYHFQYVAQDLFQTSGFAAALSTAEVDPGTAEDVGADLPTLEAGATYDYRIVATSTAPGDPVVDGEARTLTAPSVSGSEEAGGELPPSACPNQILRAGLSGHLPDCRAYEQLTPIDKEGALEAFTYLPNAALAGAVVGEDGEHLVLEASHTNWGSGQGPYLFSRGSGGWAMTSGAPQPETGIDEFRPFLFSPDLTSIGLEASWSTSENGGQSPDIEYKAGPTGGPYTTVAAAPRADVHPGNEGWAAASKDFSTLVLEVQDHELLAHQTGTTSGADLYEYREGHLSQLNVASDGQTIGTCGAKIARGEAEDEGGAVSSRHAVSPDGQRIFFEASPGSCSEPSALYMRLDGSETVEIGAYKFLAANAADTDLLLERRTGEESEFLLYDVAAATATRLFSTPRPIGDPRVSEDLSSLYFASGEALTPEAPTVGSKLFRFDLPTKTLHFLVQSNEPNSVSALTPSPSPDGRYFYFTSEGVGGLPGGGTELKGGLFEGKPTAQLYRYDNAEEVVECVSCASPFNPEPRLGFNALANTQLGTAGGVPKFAFASANGDYAFFATPAALVPEDLNGEVPPAPLNSQNGIGRNGSTSTDIYEWRRPGLNGCAHTQGCLSLITPGAEGYLVALLGIADEGRDVFFTTHSQLLPRDNDTAGDIYDARIGGGDPEPVRPVECEGDACSTPFAPPSDLTPASAIFQGAGNMAPAPVITVKPKSKPTVKRKCKTTQKTKKGANKTKKCKAQKKTGKQAKRPVSHRHLTASRRTGR
jgi:phosphodiesterase/alkaline phosphatase D-like protein